MIEMAKNKGPKFTHKEKGYSTRLIGAGKKPDGTYETQEECLARIKDIFDVDEVGCIWNDERNGFEPATEIMEVIEESEEEEAEPTKAVVGLPSGEPPAVSESKEESEESPEPVKPVMEEDKPIPSVDGEREYNLSESKGIPSLQEILDMWIWDDGDDSLKAKLVEETGEALQGDNGNAKVEGDVVTVIGTSATSEMLTIGCIVFKWLNMHGLNVEQSMKAMDLRHREQYERYKHLHN